MIEPRTARPVDASHLTGICYAMVQTTVQTTIEGARIGMASDGNGRSTSVVGIDASLGQIAQHLQVLQAHFEDQSVRDYLPGYFSPEALGDKRHASTLVWVLNA